MINNLLIEETCTICQCITDCWITMSKQNCMVSPTEVIAQHNNNNDKYYLAQKKGTACHVNSFFVKLIDFLSFLS